MIPTKTDLSSGWAFLAEQATPAEVFAPEDFDEESRMIGKAAEDFARNELLPLIPQIEKAEEGLMRELDRKMGELGFTAAEVPLQYGGLELPKTTVALIIEKLGLEPATCLTLQAHAGLAILPLVLEGNQVQKSRYLPKLASAEWCGSFCLSEPGSGSDALAMKTRATPAPDGKGYILKGEKMWVTNAGFADLFTVFAKLNGEQFTAFLVERAFDGVNPGREEDKIGLHGSSTRRVAFDDVFVPSENLLGEVGKAHYIALNTLNMGRYKMAASGLGTGKYALELGARYAQERVQFSQPIANFGLIRHKLSEMAVRLFALESMLYRLGGCLNAQFEPLHHVSLEDEDVRLQYRRAASELAGECALVKFYGTEVQHFCADESLQIHGGYGYTEDFPIAKVYRESRVPRIYEGTNEINRLNVTQSLIRRMQRGDLPLMELAREAERDSYSDLPTATAAMLEALSRQFKGATLSLYRHAWEEYGDKLREGHQEVAAAIAEMLLWTYGVDSIRLRLPKMRGTEAEAGELAALIFARESAVAMRERVDYAFRALEIGEQSLLNWNDRLQVPNVNTVALRNELTDHILKRSGYPF